MSKEIKFRVWDIDHKKMLRGALRLQANRILTWIRLQSVKGDVVWLQFSGLKDSEGVEIYAGDVIYLAGYGDYVCEFPFTELYEAANENDIGHIKGNIYENPELNL